MVNAKYRSVCSLLAARAPRVFVYYKHLLVTWDSFYLSKTSTHHAYSNCGKCGMPFFVFSKVDNEIPAILGKLSHAVNGKCRDFASKGCTCSLEVNYHSKIILQKDGYLESKYVILG